MRRTPSKTEIREARKDFHAGLQEKAKEMKVMVPRAHYLPSRSMFYSAGDIAAMIKMVRSAFNRNPETEFKASFSSWAPRTAREIIRWEIVPMIHERINVRGLLSECNGIINYE